MCFWVVKTWEQVVTVCKMRLLRQSISDSGSTEDALGRPPKANTRLGFVRSMNSERGLYKKEQLSSMFMTQASNVYEDEKIRGAKDHKT